MLFLLISSVIILPVFAGIGSFIRKLGIRFFEGFSSDVILGLLSITVFWTIIAFFIPLSFWVEMLTVLFGFLIFFLNKVYFSFNTIENKFSLFFFILASLFFASFAPYILDHFGYYVPSILWITDVGITKGISNLDLILGQMSFWHILQAGFSHFSDVYLRINFILILVFLLYIFERKSWISILFLPIFYMFLQQPSPDLPVMIFSLIILNEVLFGNKNHQFLLFFSIFIFSIKPTVVWLPLFVLGYTILAKKCNFRVIIPGLLMLVLYFAKNIITFGYPVFPMQVLDFGISWQPDSEILKNSAQLAIEKTYNLQYSYSQIKEFSNFEYIKNWLFLEGIKGKINLAFVIFIFSFGVFSFFQKNILIRILFYSIFIKSILVISFSAQYRFYLDVFLVLPFVIFYRTISFRISTLVSNFVSVIVFSIFVSPKIIQTHIPSFYLGFAMTPFQWRQIIEPSKYEYHKIKQYQIGNLEFNVVQGYPFSFDTPIPAISPSFLLEYYNAGIFPQKRGNTLRNGFFHKKLIANEKLKLKRIIDELKIENPSEK